MVKRVMRVRPVLGGMDVLKVMRSVKTSPEWTPSFVNVQRRLVFTLVLMICGTMKEQLPFLLTLVNGGVGVAGSAEVDAARLVLEVVS